MKSTSFYDMHSGGGQKEGFQILIIEAPEAEAISVFYTLFGHNPRRVSCTCCGPDYSLWEHENLDEAKEHYPGARVIPASEITAEQRSTVVPKQGYIWQD